MMNDNMVTLDNLNKRFGKVTAVDGVTLEVQSGEFVTLLGPSGCGKTTTLRMISGLEMPDSGTICLDGQDVTTTPPEKRPVNMVFQAYALFPHLSIAENIAFGPRIKKWPESKIAECTTEMLRLVQLEGYEERRPNQLSGGQAQRVALARALINEPKVLLLDEPLGALDLKLRQAMQIELRNIQQRLGMTFVYVTHDQQEAMVMSDRIVLMDKGRIVQIGTPAEIYNHPATEFVSRFIGEANLLGGAVTGIQADHAEVQVGELTLIVPRAQDYAIGQPVIVSVRPERTQLFTSEDERPGDWPNLFRGLVENVFFLGPTARYHIRLDADTVVIADRRAADSQLTYRIGETIYIGWPVSQNVVLTE